MCKHCEYPYEAIEPFGTNFEASVTVIPNSDEGATVIHSVEVNNELIETEYTVEFCPMCGQRFS